MHTYNYTERSLCIWREVIYRSLKGQSLHYYNYVHYFSLSEESLSQCMEEMSFYVTYIRTYVGHLPSLKTGHALLYSGTSRHWTTHICISVHTP